MAIQLEINNPPGILLGERVPAPSFRRPEDDGLKSFHPPSDAHPGDIFETAGRTYRVSGDGSFAPLPEHPWASASTKTVLEKTRWKKFKALSGGDAHRQASSQERIANLKAALDHRAKNHYPEADLAQIRDEIGRMSRTPADVLAEAKVHRGGDGQTREATPAEARATLVRELEYRRMYGFFSPSDTQAIEVEVARLKDVIASQPSPPPPVATQVAPAAGPKPDAGAKEPGARDGSIGIVGGPGVGFLPVNARGLGGRVSVGGWYVPAAALGMNPRRPR
ncbi:MAG: hypothetical protein HYV07_33645 [Deltaproteobacteria bacterium]|nr:hypothetical protein [Deltaproteobacteria bacterium]